MSRKNRSRKAKAMGRVAAVQQILRRWDPIGVIPTHTENQQALDEYDRYAPHIVSILATGSDEYRLRSHLNNLRTVTIGLPPNPEADAQAAKELLSWWEQSGKGPAA